MRRDRRSDCPISFSLELFGDRWSLLILRDILFRDRKYYGDFLEGPEGISTSVLADRLERLERAGLLTKHRDPADRKRFEYRITPKGLDLIPVLLEMIVWGTTHDPSTGAPPALVRRIREDREAVVAEVRSRFEPGAEAT